MEEAGRDQRVLARVRTEAGHVDFLGGDEGLLVSETRALLALVGDAANSEHRDGCQHPEDDDDDEQLHQSEPLVVVCLAPPFVHELLSARSAAMFSSDHRVE